jgi:enoyl-[acyl-carrier-protein] reductase (NADH)
MATGPMKTPMDTLLTSDIGGFRGIFRWNEPNAPLRVSPRRDDVG